MPFGCNVFLIMDNLHLFHCAPCSSSLMPCIVWYLPAYLYQDGVITGNIKKGGYRSNLLASGVHIPN